MTQVIDQLMTMPPDKSIIFFDGAEAAIVVSRFPGVSSVDNQLEARQADIALCLAGAS